MAANVRVNYTLRDLETRLEIPSVPLAYTIVNPAAVSGCGSGDRLGW
jgi:hypothetical protein